MMKILYLLSDWKWTGPAEPTVSLCEALTQKDIDVTIAYRKTPIEFPERTIEKEVKARRMKFFDGFRLNRYFSLKDWLFDVKHIKQYVDKHRIDIVHTNISHDHFTALFSLFFSTKKTLLIRTDYKRGGLAYDPFIAWALKKTDGLVTYSERIMKHDIKSFRFPVERTCVIPPAVKLFSGETKDMKEELGLKEDERVIGVIGRLKADRGYNIILKAFRHIRDLMDNVKLLIMGRSSQIEQSIKQPIAELGLENDVILAGYRIDDYYSVIKVFDVFVMMRAGSDGTARALREVMSLGIPAIVSDSGMLPELVTEGVSGFVVKPNEQELFNSLKTVLQDEQKRKILGINAKKQAIEKWSYDAQAAKIIDFYKKLIDLGKKY